MDTQDRDKGHEGSDEAKKANDREGNSGGEGNLPGDVTDGRDSGDARLLGNGASRTRGGGGNGRRDPEQPLTVVVTGASAGLGRAIVQRYARAGARIGLLARGKDGLAGARADVERLGGQALVCPTDVADPGQVEAAAEAIERELGPIDVWVNNAMTTVFAEVKDITPVEFRRATEVTYLGTVYGTMAALQRMLPRDRGVIVQVGSALAYRSIPLQAAYCGAKFAIRGFTDSLRVELLHQGANVHVTMVQMPALNTPQFDWCRAKLPRQPQPVPPIFQPEVAAEAVEWAAQRHPREIFVGGSAVATIFMNKMTPAMVDKYLARTGYGSQQTDEPRPVDRADNLFEPVPGDHGAHGRFDERAKDDSLQLWAATHHLSLVGNALSILGVTAKNAVAFVKG